MLFYKQTFIMFISDPKCRMVTHRTGFISAEVVNFPRMSSELFAVSLSITNIEHAVQIKTNNQ